MILDHDPTSFEITHTLRYQGEVDVERFREIEWLLTDGLGGYAMGTALGVNTRRYHGLLVAASRPPLGRIVALNAIKERFTFDAGGPNERSVELSTFEFHPNHLTPRGYMYLERFERGPEMCRWRFRVGDFAVVREIGLRRGRGGVEIRYGVDGPDVPVRVGLQPLMRLHDHHHLIRCGAAPFRVVGTATGIVVSSGPHQLHVATTCGVFHASPDWWFNFRYREEALRGMDDIEDLYTPGEFRHTFEPGTPRECIFRAGIEASQMHEERSMGFQPVQCESTSAPPSSAPPIRTGWKSMLRRSDHLKTLAESMRETLPQLSQRLDLLSAADDFIVTRHAIAAEEEPTVAQVAQAARRALRRSTPSPPQSHTAESTTTILAGYPWLSDWGRDAMIALPGLLLAPRRFDDAFAVLHGFAQRRQRGLILSHYDEHAGPERYNSADTSLWFIYACGEYRRASGDAERFNAQLRPAILDIIEHYRGGTDFGIRMDPDDMLIAAGDETTALTWMDARRSDAASAPRFGKPVEVNALWHHALRTLAAALADDDPQRSAEFSALADRVGESFRHRFWIARTGGLADVLVPAQGGRWVPDATIRANQLFAVALWHSPLSDDEARSVVSLCERELLTPMGLRLESATAATGAMASNPADGAGAWASSPSQAGAARQPFEGGSTRRSTASRHGTIWPWLIEPFALALMRIESFSPASREKAKSLVAPLLEHLANGRSLGHLHELYDGPDTARPRTPGGCIAQASSLAAVLRVLALAEAGEDDRAG